MSRRFASQENSRPDPVRAPTAQGKTLSPEQQRVLVNKMPGVMQKSMAIAQSQMQALIPRMKAAIDSAITDAKISKWRVTASSSPPAGDSGPWAPWNSLRDRPS